ncbi:VCBS repeat-containing protein [Haloferula sp. BvORR071]|uniref:FG-GAP repeat domain-containing protein n=1 Tax=Haloferula sp. BvORR071 TaxID=1396141 RepID=UPI0005595EDC|nr:VCBS repeat-containing protein [Haloferula sp. BvORR071]
MKTLSRLAGSSSRLSVLLICSLTAPPTQAGSEPQFRILAGAGPGGAPLVQRRDFMPQRFPFYPQAFREDLPGGSHPLPGSAIAIDEPGVHLAIGDLDGDGAADLVCSTLRGGPGGGPHIKVYRHGGTASVASLTAPILEIQVPEGGGGAGGATAPRFVAVGHFEGGESAIVTGAGAGGGPHIKVFGKDGKMMNIFVPYDDSFNSGIRVATGDVTGDGVDDIITAAGAGGGPHVKVFDGLSETEIFSFAAYKEAPAGGIYVAAGDLDGDGRAEIITATGAGGGPHVKVFSGASFGTGGPPTEVSYFPFGGRSLGGVRVAVGDLDGDGRADLAIGGVVNGRRRVEVLKSNKTGDPYANREMWTWGDDETSEGDQFPLAVGDIDKDGLAELATGGSAPRALIWSPRSNLTLNTNAFDPSFTGGVRVASGDVNGDGVPDIVVAAGAGGAPHVKAFDGRTNQLLRSFLAYDVAFTGGVTVATGDVNGDGVADIVTGAAAGGGPHVKVFDGKTGAEIRSFLAYRGFAGGVSVAAGDLNGDGRAEIITGARAGGGPHVKVFDGSTGVETNSFFAFDLGYTGGVEVAALGDGRLRPTSPPYVIISKMVGGGAGGGPHVKVFDGLSSADLGSYSPFGDDFTGGITVATGDVDGDGVPELLAGGSPVDLGPTVLAFDLQTQVQECCCRFSLGGRSPVGVPGEAPSIAISARPSPNLVLQPGTLTPGGLYQFRVVGTPGSWVDFEGSDDLVNWLPLSSQFIPDGDHTLIGTTTPVVQGTRHYYRASSK